MASFGRVRHRDSKWLRCVVSVVVLAAALDEARASCIVPRATSATAILPPTSSASTRVPAASSMAIFGALLVLLRPSGASKASIRNRDTMHGCTCKERWSLGDGTCKDGPRFYSGCGMSPPCDGVSGTGVWTTWCVTTARCPGNGGARWDYCRPDGAAKNATPTTEVRRRSRPPFSHSLRGGPIIIPKARARRSGCSLACKDVAAAETVLSSGGKNLSCTELQSYCQHSEFGGKVRSRCPETCGQCKSTSCRI